jgi:hypothetical protein
VDGHFVLISGIFLLGIGSEKSISNVQVRNSAIWIFFQSAPGFADSYARQGGSTLGNWIFLVGHWTLKLLKGSLIFFASLRPGLHGRLAEKSSTSRLI